MMTEPLPDDVFEKFQAMTLKDQLQTIAELCRQLQRELSKVLAAFRAANDWVPVETPPMESERTTS